MFTLSAAEDSKIGELYRWLHYHEIFIYVSEELSYDICKQSLKEHTKHFCLRHILKKIFYSSIVDAFEQKYIDKSCISRISYL